MISKSIVRKYDIRAIFDMEFNEQSVKLTSYHLGKRISGQQRVATLVNNFSNYQDTLS